MEAKRCRIPVNIFNRPSDHESISLKIECEYNLEEAKKMIGKTVFVDWPFLRPAIVSTVFTKEECEDRTINDAIFFNKSKRGINVSNCKVWIGAHPLRYASIDQQTFEPMERLCCIPFDLVVPMTSDNKFNNCSEPEPKEGMTVISKRDGRKGIIIKKNPEEDKALIKFYPKSEIDLSEIINDDEKEWIKVSDVAEEYGISGGALCSLLSTLKAKRVDDDISMTLFFGHNCVEGYARKTNGVQEITRSAKDYLDRYFEIASPLKEFIKTLKGSLKFVTLENLVEGEDDSEMLRKANELVRFVNGEAPASRSFLVDCGLRTVSQSTLSRCEERLTEASFPHSPAEEVELPLSDLIWPGRRAEGRPARVGDRVVSVQPCGSVPFGTAGTVVAFDPERREAHVLADEEMTFATNLRKRLQTNRGFVAKVSDIWNCSLE